jgi:molybdopterin molybdotransferase
LLDDVDMVLVTGGTGPSEIDLFYRLPEKLGGELVFRGLRVIGGKPTSGMVVNGKPVIGLSGYPLSALHGFIRLVYPLLSYMANLRKQPPLPIYKAVLGGELKVKRARPIKARLVMRDGKLVAEPLEHVYQRSSALVALAYADGLILAEEGVHKPGEEVLVLAYRVPADYYAPSINF